MLLFVYNLQKKEGIYMKKIISTIIVSVMMLSLITPVFAQNNNSQMQEILISVKERITDTSVFDEFTSNMYEDSGKVGYYFNWNKSDDESYSYLSINVNSQGIITSYSYYDEKIWYNDVEVPSIDKMSNDEALEKAKLLVKELNPDIYDSLVISKISDAESLFSDEYTFNVQRYENGVPVYGNNGSVTVNAEADKIIRFSLNYETDINFTSKTDYITEEEAWKAFSEKQGVELVYQTDYSDDEEKIRLVYLPVWEHSQYIDASGGEIKEIDYGYITTAMSNYSNVKEMAIEDSAAGERLTETEISELEDIEGLISKDDAQKAVRALEVLDLDDRMELISINSYVRGEEKERYYKLNFQFSDEENNLNLTGWATVNARTGKLISWQSYKRNDVSNKNEKEIDRNVIEAAAYDALKILAPEHFADDNKCEYVKDTDEESYNKQTVVYTRYVNELKFDEDTVNVTVNPENNKISSFNISYSEKEFPSPEGVFSKEEIQNKLSQMIEYELYYITLKSDKNSKFNDKAVLGYLCDELSYIKLDPFSGEWINKNDYEQESALVYDDISGHYAEEIINKLGKFRIGFEGREFKPDEIITQEDYISLLVATFINRNPIVLKADNELSWEFQYAQRYEFLKEDELNPQKPVTRENAAVYMIRALGIEEYANLSGIYNCMFPDAINNIGSISILGAMKVFNGDENGNFNPDKQLTRAEAAVVIYNYLTR